MINIEEFSDASALEAIKNYHENEGLNPKNKLIPKSILFETTKNSTSTNVSLHSFSKAFKINYSRYFIICDAYKLQWFYSCQHDANVSSVAKKLFATDYSAFGIENDAFLFDRQLGKITLRGKFHEDAYTDTAYKTTIEKYINNITTLTSYNVSTANDALTNKMLKQILDFYYSTYDTNKDEL